MNDSWKNGKRLASFTPANVLQIILIVASAAYFAGQMKETTNRLDLQIANTVKALNAHEILDSHGYAGQELGRHDERIKALERKVK